MRQVIGIDVYRTFGDAGRLRHVSRIDMTRTALAGSGQTLPASDELVLEAT